MKITKNQYCTLLGLCAVADRQWEILKNLEDLARGITKEKSDMGHTADFLAQNREIDELLKLLKIEVGN